MEENEAQASGVWPELEALAQPARERRRLPPDTRSRIILQLCQRAPLSVKDLSVLLDRSEAYIGDAIRPLVNGGDLTFLYPDQPRHPRQKYITAVSQPGIARAAPRPTAPLAPPNSPVPERSPAPPERYVPQVSSTPEPARAPQAENPLPRAVSRRRKVGYQLINLAVVLAVGIVLGRYRVGLWPLYAAVASALLAMGHVVTNSAQLQQFHALQGSRNRALAFVILKAGVAMAEIAVVYAVTRAFTGSP